MPSPVINLPFNLRYPVIVCFVLLMILENLFPLRTRKNPLPSRFFINLCFSVSTFLIGLYIVRPVGLTLGTWTAEHQFGLLQIIHLNSYIQFILGFLLMDLSFYYWHRANHIFPLFIRFHKVHHIDPDMDASTSFRFHWGEILYSTGFRALQVIVIGVSPATYVVYEFIFAIATIFHHSNLKLPLEFERKLNWIFVTPRMHGIHHSNLKEEANSNYSVIFRWWDMLNASLRLNVPQADISIGVSEYQTPEDNQLSNLLLTPFRKPKKSMRIPSEVDRDNQDISNIMLD